MAMTSDIVAVLDKHKLSEDTQKAPCSIIYSQARATYGHRECSAIGHLDHHLPLH